MKLKNISVRNLRRELARRESGAAKLSAKHADLSKRIAGLEAELADLGMDAAPARRGPKPGRMGKRGPGRPKGSKAKSGKVGGKRAKNAMALPEAIATGVKVGATVSPAQAAVAAKKAGYKTTSANFGMIVANCLAKDGNYKKLGRGQYKRTK